MSRQSAAIFVHCSIPTKLFRPLSSSALKSLSFVINALILPLAWAQPALCDVEELVYMSSMPFSSIKFNAKVGL
jgi:hypothetical protein